MGLRPIIRAYFNYLLRQIIDCELDVSFTPQGDGPQGPLAPKGAGPLRGVMLHIICPLRGPPAGGRGPSRRELAPKY